MSQGLGHAIEPGAVSTKPWSTSRKRGFEPANRFAGGWGRGRMGRGVAGPLRALMAEVDREGHVVCATPPDLAAVSARWARVSDAIRATVRARIFKVKV